MRVASVARIEALVLGVRHFVTARSMTECRGRLSVSSASFRALYGADKSAVKKHPLRGRTLPLRARAW